MIKGCHPPHPPEGGGVVLVVLHPAGGSLPSRDPCGAGGFPPPVVVPAYDKAYIVL